MKTSLTEKLISNPELPTSTTMSISGSKTSSLSKSTASDRTSVAMGDDDPSSEHESEDDERRDDDEDEDNKEEDEEYDECLRKVSKALKDVAPPGGFFVCGQHSVFPQPVVTVEGLGDLVPPLTDAVMKELIAKCHLAPYGHGEKTLVDTHIRNTWQLSVGQFDLSNPAWLSFVKDTIVPSIRVPLGIDDGVQVEAKLYKMLLYETGGKFEKHQDSEKEDGMFGTLVVVLPGRFESGELVVYDPSTARDTSSTTDTVMDGTKTHVWDPAAADMFGLKYAAFYGDCPHEVKPVAKGHRLCLTYNLVNVGERGSEPRFGGNHPTYMALKETLCEFFTDTRASVVKTRRVDEDGSKQASGFDISKTETHRKCKLVYILNHQYTKAGLAFKYLKNKDARVAKSFARFCGESDGAFELYMCKIKYEFEWRGNDMTSYDSHKELGHEETLEKRLNLLTPWAAYRDDEGYYPVSTKSSWKSVQGKLLSEVVPVGKFERTSFKFDNSNEELYTGNEGACLEKWYESGALLLMPAAVAIKHQLRGNPELVFERWVALTETNPSRARALASSFECAFLQQWSLVSETGVQALEAARRLGSLDVIRCVLTCAGKVEFQPKLRETVAAFSTEGVVAMAKAVCHGWEKRGDYTITNFLSSNRVNMVASLLDGVVDPATITTMLNGVPLGPRQCGNCKADEYARLLLLSSRVSLDQAKKLLCEKDAEFFLGISVPATIHLTASCGSCDWGVVKPVANYAMESLVANESLLKNAAYVAVAVSCQKCPYCDCKAVTKFLSSDADSQTLTARQAKRLETLKLKELIKMEPTTGKPGAMLATKTYESKDVAKMQEQLRTLREAVAKQTQ